MVWLGFYIIIRWCALLYHSSLSYNTVLWYLCPGVPNIDLTRNETHSVFFNFNFNFNFLKNKGKWVKVGERIAQLITTLQFQQI